MQVQGFSTTGMRGDPRLNEVQAAALMVMPPPPLKPGQRCFRSIAAAFQFPVWIKQKRQVGDEVLPATHRICRFEPRANSLIGELITDEAEIIKLVEGLVEYARGEIVDAEVAFANAKQREADAVLAQAEADPEFAKRLVAALGKKKLKSFADLLPEKAGATAAA